MIAALGKRMTGPDYLYILPELQNNRVDLPYPWISGAGTNLDATVKTAFQAVMTVSAVTIQFDSFMCKKLLNFVQFFHFCR